ncbi:aldehyde dehydrogenase family protein [Rhodobacteraceae bacterium M385]|nr:aldehyde dehydrogenase family protein [Rhodobacteraceae bacterium M385]
MTTATIFETMDYGPAPESSAEALAWLEARGGIAGHFINGTWGPLRDDFASNNPATGEKLAGVTKGTADEVAQAVKAARKAQPAWAKDAGKRARVLYAIARLMQKHSRLLATMETLDNGKPIRESRDIDVPLATRHFYYHAGLAQLLPTEMPDHSALGVCGQIIPWNFPLLMLAWKIAPALAAGNTVVLKPAEYTSLSAMVFAEICTEAGVPPGVVNIITGDGETGAALVAADVDKIAFTGSTEVGRRIREQTAGSGKHLTLELGGKSPYIVFDDADIDSAIEGLVDAIWFNQGQVCCAGSRLLVQENIADDFHKRLKARMAKLRMGDPMDKCIDVGAIVDPVQHDTITRLVAASDGDIHHAPIDMPETGCFYPPTLITGLHTASPLMQEEIFGPVLVSTTFRTPAEAIEVANNTRYGLAATLWTENVNLALDIAPKLVAGVVWVNATNLFDAAAPFGGLRESGFGREGGWEGLGAYLKPNAKTTPAKALTPPKAPTTPAVADLDRTAKMYVGGKQARPDSGYSQAHYSRKGTLLGHTGRGSRKDIRNAVEAARGAAKWGKSTGHLRAQILYFLAENLSARSGEFATRIADSLGTPQGKAATEVDQAISTLFTAAAWADKFDGTAKGVPLRGVALAMKEPVGIIGAFAPDDAPLLASTTLLAGALAMGNRIVLAPSQAAPLVVTDLYQVLDTSDVPAGVVNIVTGPHADLAPTLASHMEIDSLWSFSPHTDPVALQAASASNLKRTWINTSGNPDWTSPNLRPVLEAATETKTIWIPYGE